MVENETPPHVHRPRAEAPAHVRASERSAVRGWLRAEGAAAFGFGLAAFAVLGEAWWLFLALILLPDLAMAGYLRNARTGALLYNAAHSYVGPALMASVGLATAPALLPFAAAWVAHIGLDRALGYGLKLPEGFSHTHLGRIGG